MHFKKIFVLKRYAFLLMLGVILLMASACGSKTVDGKTKEEWIAVLAGGDETERLAAIKAVGQFGPEASEAVPHLIEILESEDEAERLETVIALGKIGPTAGDAVGPLFLTLEGENLMGEFANETAAAIAAIAQEKAVPMCQLYFELENLGYTSFCSVMVLPNVGADAIPGLVDILNTSDHEQSRIATIFTLKILADDCEFGSNKQLAVDTLQNVTGNDSSDKVRKSAQEAVEKISQCGE